MRTAIPVEWGVNDAYARSGRVVSLSTRGCLIRTDHVEPLYGKTVYLRFPLPDDDDVIALEGHVIYYLRDVGFAVEFSEMPDREHYLLARLVHDFRRGDPYKARGDEAPRLGASTNSAALFRDQRRYARAKVAINVDWGTTPACEFAGDRVTSLSVGGCFIQTERQIKEGSAVYVRLWEMPGGRGTFRGVVRYQLQLSPKHPPIGLGLEFPDLGPDEAANLKEVLNFFGEAITT